MSIKKRNSGQRPILLSTFSSFFNLFTTKVPQKILNILNNFTQFSVYINIYMCIFI